MTRTAHRKVARPEIDHALVVQAQRVAEKRTGTSMSMSETVEQALRHYLAYHRPKWHLWILYALIAKLTIALIITLA